MVAAGMATAAGSTSFCDDELSFRHSCAGNGVHYPDHTMLRSPGRWGGGEADSRQACVCGTQFLVDANFCKKCGAQRPTGHDCFTSLAEMLTVVEGMHMGAAEAVFEKVKSALEVAAQSAAEGINANVKTLACIRAGYGITPGLEAVGLLRTTTLGGTRAQCKAGFQSNKEVICQLLHLAVQLTLFPHGPLTSWECQAGPPFSAFKESGSQYEPRLPTRSTAFQTDPIAAPPPPRKPGPCVGVRIGGGYHLLRPPDDSDDDNAAGEEPAGGSSSMAKASSPKPCQTAGSASPDSPRAAKPLLEDVANETLRISSRSSSPLPKMIGSPANWTSVPLVDEKPPQEPTQKMPYGFGARSDGVPGDRYRVGAYVPGVASVEVEPVLHQRTAKKYRDGDGVQLSRYLAHTPRAPSPSERAKQQARRGASAPCVAVAASRRPNSGGRHAQDVKIRPTSARGYAAVPGPLLGLRAG